MNTYERRDLKEARRFVLQGLWWQRVTPPAAATVRPTLEWAMQAACAGQALPPLGFVAHSTPGVIKSALDAPPEDVLNQGWESLRQDGGQPLIAQLYEALVAAA